VKSDEEGSETLPLLHGALVCVYNGVVRRKSQYTTLKWHFLHNQLLFARPRLLLGRPGLRPAAQGAREGSRP